MTEREAVDTRLRKIVGRKFVPLHGTPMIAAYLALPIVTQSCCRLIPRMLTRGCHCSGDAVPHRRRCCGALPPCFSQSSAKK